VLENLFNVSGCGTEASVSGGVRSYMVKKGSPIVNTSIYTYNLLALGLAHLK